jgi:hypothetical protein
MSDCGGDVETSFTSEQLLTNLTIYWMTETINSSMRVGYYEYAHHAVPPVVGNRIGVPAGFAVFTDDFRPGSAWPPRELAEHSVTNVTQWSLMPRAVISQHWRSQISPYQHIKWPTESPV